ncbi:MAG: hypothetical protein WCP03_00090 [Candidatus Saccharibacteria bacterium]
MKFVTDKKALVIELHGREQVWALKAKISVYKKDIINVEYKDVFNDWRKWEVRLPGTGMPGKLVAGSFWTEDGWDFLYLTNPHGWLNPFVHNVLFIETKLQKFHRIVISCNEDEAKKVVRWAKNRR